MRERGDYSGMVRSTSLYTRARMHPVLASMAVVAAGMAVAALFRSK